MYGEWLVLYNTVFNYVLLAFTSEVSGLRIRKRRLLLSACMSGWISVLFWENFLGSIASFIVLLVIAFGFQISNFIRRGVVVWIAALFLGGALLLLQPYIHQLSFINFLIVCSLVGVLILYLFYRSWQYERQQRLEGNFVLTTKLTIDNTDISLSSYVDTGNVCTEPLSGKPVHFISYTAVEANLPMDWREGLERWRVETPYDISMLPKSLSKRIRFIQLSTVQQESSIALAIRFEKWELLTLNKVLTEEYVVLVKNAANFPKQTEAILHVSTLIAYA